MQSLQVQASEKSGVNQEDAFEIDKSNLYERLGHQCFINLSTNFYTRYIRDFLRHSKHISDPMMLAGYWIP